MMSFCVVPWSTAASTPFSSAVDDVERQQPRGGRVDRHRRVHPVERDAVEQRAHVALVGDRARRPCRPRRGPARGRRRSPSASAGRRRSRAPSAPWRGCRGRARWTWPRSSGPRTSASSRACRARAGGGSCGDCPASGITPRHARDRHPAPRHATGDRLLGGRRRARSTRARSRRERPLLEALDGEVAARDPAHAHPLRPRGRDRRAVRRWPDVPVYVHERGARHMADPGAARGQRRAALRRGGRPARALWGEVVAGARGEPPRAHAAARPCSTTSASSTRPATPRTTSPTCTSRAAWRSSATSPASRIPPSRATSSRRRRRPTSTSRPGTARSTSSQAGSRRRSR